MVKSGACRSFSTRIVGWRSQHQDLAGLLGLGVSPGSDGLLVVCSVQQHGGEGCFSWVVVDFWQQPVQRTAQHHPGGKAKSRLEVNARVRERTTTMLKLSDLLLFIVKG